MKNNQLKSKIFYLAFGYGIKTQIVKIKKKFFSTRKMAMISTVVFLAVGTAIFFSANYFAKGATYGWIQEGWSGGADESAVANHTDDREGWLKFFSKDDEITVNGSGDLTLSGATSDWQETDDEDFNAGTKSDVYVAGGDVKLKKPDGASCSSAGECYSEVCVSNICGEWLSGPCAGFDVYYIDRVGTANWSTAMSYCDSFCPTCDLPTLTELQCIYTNRASFGNNFVATTGYWSATELNSTSAYSVDFNLGFTYPTNKTLALYVRCVRR